MYSMTGYGSGKATVAGITVSIELRSVNHRFLDTMIKLPPTLSPLESEVVNHLKKSLGRGRISCSAQLESTTETARVVLDSGRLEQGLKQLHEAARQLEQQTGQRAEIRLDHLLAIPDLFRTEETVLEGEDVRGATLQALDLAVQQLMAMKGQEGRELRTDLERRLGRLQQQLSRVRELAAQAGPEALARLKARLKQLISEEIDPQRLAQEAALLADRVSINEECERLASHLEQYVQVLQENGPVAKRLNFLLQEIHREVNTIGSKSNLIEITQIVIAMKDEVESMREQVQNLE